MKNIKLSNGVTMPEIGYGTYKIDDDIVEQRILEALEAGYRHIDTAIVYGNEAGIGRALKRSHVDRNNLFITSKIWHDDQGYESALEAVHNLLQRLQTDYLDLCLIHWATPRSEQTWNALEELYNKGVIRAIGLSNFHPHHYEKLMKTAKIQPMVIQLERHPFLVQNDLKEYYDKLGIVTQAWSPFAKGKVFENEVLKELALKHGISISQLVIAWQLATGWIPLPKSSTYERMFENLDVSSVRLSGEDIVQINSLNENLHTGSNPDRYDF